MVLALTVAGKDPVKALKDTSLHTTICFSHHPSCAMVQSMTLTSSHALECTKELATVCSKDTYNVVR